MTTIKKIFRVFISCPSDVDKEREWTREACEDISKTHGISDGIEVKPIDYRNELIPFISGTRTQEMISDQLEKPGYEIYIGIFWKRFGDKKSNGLTPSEEEYQNALKSRMKNGKPLMSVFFKCKGYFLKTVEEAEQIIEVTKFKDKIRENDIGMYQEFKNTVDFYQKVRNVIVGFVLRYDFFTNKKFKKVKIICEEFINYIPRKIISIQDFDSKTLFNLTEKQKDFIDIILEQDRVVLIGGAGSGKTTELNRINFAFSKNESTFVSYSIPLRNYTTQSICELLPKDWDKKFQKIPIIILDGLDEIESKNKSDAIRNIELFSMNYPNIKIVVSCRNNFYNSESKNYSGTLKGFSTYILLDLDAKGIYKYLKKKLGIHTEDFNEIINKYGLQNTIKIPFLLNILSDLFKKKKIIPLNRIAIFEEIINLMIAQDIEKYRTTKDLMVKKDYIISIIEIIALVMETLGRNYIYDEELEKIPQVKNRKEILELCMIKKKKQGNKIIWNFEHNVFQEYLAARLLSRQSFEIMKKFTFFPPYYKTIIPSWLNTMSFLVSNCKNNDLINWIIEKCPETVVKFEKGRIKEVKRIEIFKMVFNRYKKNKTWINQDKFRYFELANFGRSIETINFLLEAGNKEYHYTTTFNVIELLRYMNISISADMKKNIKDFLLNIALNYENEIVQSHALLALADLKLNSKETIDKILEKLRSSSNDRIRYAIYYLMSSSEYLDENIDICLEGFQYCSKMEIVTDPGIRKETRILDEEFELRNCLTKANSFDAIKKIVKYFIEQPEQLENPIFEKIIKDIAENAANIYFEHQEVFIFLVDLLISFVKKYMDKQAKEIVYFFDKTNTRFQAFKKVYYEKLILKEDLKLLAILADKECIEFVISEYLEGKIKDENIKMFQNVLNWEHYSLFLIFNKEINDKTNGKFLVTLPKSHEKERKERIQKDFDLLFDGNLFLEEIKKVFDKENKISFSREELLSLKMKYLKNYNFSDIVLHTLIEIAKEKEITLKNIEEYKNKNWESFYIFKIYKYLNLYDDLKVSSKQKEFIESWCKRNLEDVGFKNALLVKEDGKTFNANTLAIYLWYFLRKFKLCYPKNILLDMLSFDWLEKNSMVGIGYLQEYLSIKDITQRIFENLEKGKDNKYALKNYLSYCQQKGVKEIIPYAKNIIISFNRDYNEGLRNKALEVICKMPTALDELEQLLTEVKDKFKWRIIEKLFEKKSKKLKKFLKESLKKPDDEDKLNLC
jgi:predicted NACHT family NTPase